MRITFILIGLLCFYSTVAQTITENINDSVFWGNDTITLDIDGDMMDDISIQRYGVLDFHILSATSLHSGVTVTSPVETGQNFNNFGGSANIQITTILCLWSQSWPLNSGVRYIGYAVENSTGDTTFGYISADFIGGTNCDDTLFVNSHTYMNPSNINLTGGQIITDIAVIINNLNVYPNPTNDFIKLDIEGYNGPVNVEVYDLSGRLLDATRKTTVSLRKYERGIYVFKVSYGDKVEEIKVVKE